MQQKVPKTTHTHTQKPNKYTLITTLHNKTLYLLTLAIYTYTARYYTYCHSVYWQFLLVLL